LPEQAFAVVEVVAEGGADLGLGFEGGDEFAFDNDEEAPAFAWAEIAGQFEGVPVVNVRTVDAGLGHQLCQEFHESVHLRAPSDRAAKALIGATGLALFLRLAGSGLPVEADGLACVFWELGEDGRPRHSRGVLRTAGKDSIPQW